MTDSGSAGFWERRLAACDRDAAFDVFAWFLRCANRQLYAERGRYRLGSVCFAEVNLALFRLDRARTPEEREAARAAPALIALARHLDGALPAEPMAA